VSDRTAALVDERILGFLFQFFPSEVRMFAHSNFACTVVLTLGLVVPAWGQEAPKPEPQPPPKTEKPKADPMPKSAYENVQIVSITLIQTPPKTKLRVKGTDGIEKDWYQPSSNYYYWNNKSGWYICNAATAIVENGYSETSLLWWQSVQQSPCPTPGNGVGRGGGECTGIYSCCEPVVDCCGPIWTSSRRLFLLRGRR
jgi:hypothetical protein